MNPFKSAGQGLRLFDGLLAIRLYVPKKCAIEKSSGEIIFETGNRIDACRFLLMPAAIRKGIANMDIRKYATPYVEYCLQSNNSQDAMKVSTQNLYRVALVLATWQTFAQYENNTIIDTPEHKSDDLIDTYFGLIPSKTSYCQYDHHWHSLLYNSQNLLAEDCYCFMNRRKRE